MLDDFIDSAIYSGWLRAKDDTQRFRIAARDGKPVVWAENVLTDHRNRFEGANHADRHDLSWVRSRLAGPARHDQPGGAPAPAP